MDGHQRNRPARPAPPPGGHPRERGDQQAIVGVDPVLRDYLRVPYDPYYSALMEGRATGTVIARPPRHGWMRLMAFLLVIALFAGALIGISEIAGAVPEVFPAGHVVGGIYVLLVSSPFTAAGVLLLWRLIRRPSARGAGGDHPA
ncbi:MAG TPA: hypothetical protein VFW96_01875 [Thermomicrobiales bacterium]|nr:hypothetical protein [Thermomicrobiales bacterium]